MRAIRPPLCYLLTILSAVISNTAAAAEKSAASPVQLQSRHTAGQTDRVAVLLEIGGEILFQDEGQAKREKMNVRCELEYVEKTLASPGVGALRSVRDYRKVAVKGAVGGAQFDLGLRPERRLIAVEAAGHKAVLFSPTGALTRDELDALEIRFNSLLLDQLLPEKPAVVGQSRPLSEQLTAALLGLDEVAKTTLESTLIEIGTAGSKDLARQVARFELKGSVEGAVGGVSTSIDVVGKYRFDMQCGRIDWIGLIIKEKREKSFIEDGVEAVSRLQVTIQPDKEPESLSEAALAKLDLEPTEDRKRLVYVCSEGGWECEYDRRWYVHQRRPNSPDAVLRLLDRGALTGQCNLSTLPARDADKPVSMEEFQDDVRRALGGSFGEFVQAGQSTNESGCRVYRVVVDGVHRTETPGKLPEIPMRWIYYLLTDPGGRRVAFTFVLEREHIEPFADADRPLVRTLRFVEREKQIAERPARDAR